MKPAILDTLDNIFNATCVKINGLQRPLRFTLKAELWLEREGLRLDNLAGSMVQRPLETSLKLVFAGLPAAEYRENLSFEDFVKSLSEEEARGILARVNAVLSAFYRHVLAVFEKKSSVASKALKSEEDAANDLMNVVNFLAVHFRWDYKKIGELSRLEIKELCKAYVRYQREQRSLRVLDDLNNLRVTVPMGLPSKKAIESANRAAEERARQLLRDLEPEKQQSPEEIEAAVDALDKEFEGI